MECSICFNSYSSIDHIPYSLPCGHSFCSICLESFFRLNPLQLKCPNCSIIHLNLNSLNQLSKNWTLISLLNDLNPFQPLSSSSNLNLNSLQVFCEVCDDKHRGTYKCIDCDQIICYKLSLSHTKFKLTKNHRVLEYENAIEYLKKYPNTMLQCSDHPTEKKNFFDEDCQILVCSSCVILGKHNGLFLSFFLSFIHSFFL